MSGPLVNTTADYASYYYAFDPYRPMFETVPSGRLLGVKSVYCWINELGLR